MFIEENIEKKLARSVRIAKAIEKQLISYIAEYGDQDSLNAFKAILKKKPGDPIKDDEYMYELISGFLNCDFTIQEEESWNWADIFNNPEKNKNVIQVLQEEALDMDNGITFIWVKQLQNTPAKYIQEDKGIMLAIIPSYLIDNFEDLFKTKLSISTSLPNKNANFETHTCYMVNWNKRGIKNIIHD